jgi:hypothetical protein
MLGILQMDVQTCIDEYVRLAPRIFPLESSASKMSIIKVSKMILGKTRFDPRPLKQEMKGLIGKHLENRSTAGENTTMKFEATSIESSTGCKV